MMISAVSVWTIDYRGVESRRAGRTETENATGQPRKIPPKKG